MNLRALIAAVRLQGVEAPSDAAVAHCIGDICADLLAGSAQRQNWADEIVTRAVAHFQQQQTH